MDEEEWPEIDKAGLPPAAWWRWCVEGATDALGLVEELGPGGRVWVEPDGAGYAVIYLGDL